MLQIRGGGVGGVTHVMHPGALSRVTSQLPYYNYYACMQGGGRGGAGGRPHATPRMHACRVEAGGITTCHTAHACRVEAGGTQGGGHTPHRACMQGGGRGDHPMPHHARMQGGGRGDHPMQHHAHMQSGGRGDGHMPHHTDMEVGFFWSLSLT